MSNLKYHDIVKKRCEEFLSKETDLVTTSKNYPIGEIIEDDFFAYKITEKYKITGGRYLYYALPLYKK